MKKGFLSVGHLPTLFASFLYFDMSFMVWVLLGPLGVQIAKDLDLSPAQKGFMVAVPVLSGALLRIVAGIMVDRLRPKLTGIVLQAIVIASLLMAWFVGVKSFEATLAGVARVRSHLKGPVFAVLGNHDTIRMVPGFEGLGVRVLLNESEIISRASDRIYLAGIDDAHFYRVDDIGKAVAGIPHGDFAILLSHTPEIYRQAARAGFRLLLSGHTHGGQICLPGSIPITLDSHLPRRFGAGAWTFDEMVGYTSVGAGSCIVPVRLNCPPEITLHHLHCS